MDIIKKNTNNFFDMVRFDTVTLFSFDFLSNFFKSMTAAHYVAFSFFIGCVSSEELKESLNFPRFSQEFPRFLRLIAVAL